MPLYTNLLASANTFAQNQTILTRLIIGPNTPSADTSVIMIERDLTGQSTNTHAIRDETTLDPITSGQYASFDAAPTLSGSFAYDHTHGFQSRIIWNGTTSIARHVGFWHNPTFNGAGTVALNIGLDVLDYLGTSPVTTQYGILVNALTKATTNWGIYVVAPTNSYLGGDLTIGGNTGLGVTPTHKLHVLVTDTLTSGFTNSQITLDYTANPAGNSTSQHTGAYIEAKWAASFNATDATYGLSGITAVARISAGTGTVTTVGGNNAIIGTYSAGNITNARAFQAVLSRFGAGTITNFVGYYVAAPIFSTSPVTNQYGLYVTAISAGGTSNYSIYTNAGDVRLMGSATDKLGLFGATPVARPAAYTQTYATTTRTFSAYTANDQSAAYTGQDNLQVGTVYAKVADLNTLRTAYENMRAFNENVGKLLNQVLDDWQAFGALG